jgi:hypothetical protein
VTMARGAAALRPGGWRRLGRPKEGDDAGGGPSGPQCWAQSKNGPKDLMGHHGEVGRDGLLRWQAREMKRKPEITYGLQRSTGRIEMGCGKFSSQFSNKDLGFKIKDSNTFKLNLNWNQTWIN